METIEEYEITEQPLPFRVENDGQATWAMKKLRDLVLKIRENEQIAKEQIETVTNWLKEVNSSLGKQCAYFEDQLTDYMRRERDNRKSIKLPWGTIKSTATSKVEVDDQFIEWAQKNHRDDLLRFPAPQPDIAAIKAAGELPHVTVVEGVSYSVKVKE